MNKVTEKRPSPVPMQRLKKSQLGSLRSGKAKSSSSNKSEAKSKGKGWRWQVNQGACCPKWSYGGYPSTSQKNQQQGGWKRPAAAEKKDKPSVSKYKYPNGSFGYKVNTKQVLTVTCVALIVRLVCHVFSNQSFTSVWTHRLAACDLSELFETMHPLTH